MKFCSKCGTQVDDNVRFCPSCGTDLDNKPAESSASSANVENRTPITKKLSWQRLVSKILLIISKIVSIIGIVFFGIVTVIFAILGITASGAIYDFYSIFGLGEITGGVLGGGVAIVTFLLLLIMGLFIVALVFSSKVLKKIKKFKKISVGLKVCVLIFVNILPGIFLLTESNADYEE